MPACSSNHSALCNTETISQHSRSGINKTSRWHKSVPEGITRLVSSFTSPPCWMHLKFTRRLCLLWCCAFVTLLPQILPLFCIFIYFIIMLLLFFFPFHTRSSADPPGSFNSTITQHSTISARVSAGRIRVTWATPDCNQSENNECRTKAGAITLAGLTFLSLSFFFFFFCFLSVERNSKTEGGKRKRMEQARLVVKE